MAGDKIRELEIFNAKIDGNNLIYDFLFPFISDMRNTWQIYLPTTKRQSWF